MTAGPDKLLLGIRGRKEFYKSKVKHNCKHKPGNTVEVGWKFNGKEMVIFPAIFLVEYNCNIGHNAPNGFSTWKNEVNYMYLQNIRDIMVVCREINHEKLK